MGFNTMIACQHLDSHALPSPKSSCFTVLSLTTLLKQLSIERVVADNDKNLQKPVFTIGLKDNFQTKTCVVSVSRNSIDVFKDYRSGFPFLSLYLEKINNENLCHCLPAQYLLYTGNRS